MNNQKLEKWISYLDRINPEVHYLLENRKIFRLLVSEHNSGKFVDPRIWSFIKSNYQGNMTMCVCRQIDLDDNTISLLGLMKDLLKNYEMVTKKWFISNFPKSDREPTFVKLFKDGEIVDVENLRQDIKILKEQSEAVCNHRDKRIAHSDRNQQIPKEPVFNDIDKCVNVIEELFNKYYYLLKQSAHHY